MVKVGQSTEELSRAAHLVTDDNSAFTAAFDFKDFNNGSVSLFDIPHDFLVNLDRIRRCFLEEDWVRDGTDVSFAKGEIEC